MFPFLQMGSKRTLGNMRLREEVPSPTSHYWRVAQEGLPTASKAKGSVGELQCAHPAVQANKTGFPCLTASGAYLHLPGEPGNCLPPESQRKHSQAAWLAAGRVVYRPPPAPAPHVCISVCPSLCAGVWASIDKLVGGHLAPNIHRRFLMDSQGLPTPPESPDTGLGGPTGSIASSVIYF